MCRHALLLAISFVALLLGPAIRADDGAGKASWQPVGLSGGGAMFHPVISPADPKVAILHCDMSAAYLGNDCGLSWEMIDTAQLRSNTRCSAAFHPTDPEIIYSPHGSSTIRISRDAGLHWQDLAKFDAPLIGPILINPHNPAQILVGAGETVRFSTDAGKAFHPLKALSGYFTGAHFTPAGELFIATTRGLWQSTDDAQSFADASTGLPSKNIRSFSGGTWKNATALYCTVPSTADNGHYAGGVYRWTSTSKAWQPAGTTGLTLDTKRFDRWGTNPITQFHGVVTCDEEPGTVYVAAQGTGIPVPHHCTIYRSNDGGMIWHQTFFPDPRYKNFNVEKDYTVVEDGQFYQSIPDIDLDPHNPGHLLTICGGNCYFTTDGGKSWRCGHTKPAADPKPGVAWENTGLVVTTTWNYYIDPHDPNRHYICYTDLGFARSLDAGQTWIWWSQKNSSPWRNTCYELAFDPDRAGKIWGAFSDVHDIPNANIIFDRHRADRPGGICLSDDFAATWKPLTNNSLPQAPCTSIVLDPKSPKTARTLYAAFFGKGIYKSTDDGKTWTQKNTGLGSPEDMRVCRVEIHPDGTLFALVTALRKNNHFVEQGPGLYRSTNAGDSWQLITASIPALWPKDFSLDPKDSRIVYLGLCDANAKPAAGLYRTTDAGASWNLLTRQGPEHFGGYLNPHHPGWIYATLCEGAPSHGLFLSKDNGKTFNPVAGMPFDNAMRVTPDPANPNLIYVTTFGGSVWRGPAD